MRRASRFIRQLTVVAVAANGGWMLAPGVSHASAPSVAGSIDALTVDATPDGGLQTVHFDPSIGGNVSLSTATLSGSDGSSTASVHIPVVPGPGSYPVGDPNATTPISLNLTTDGQTCTTETGTLTVLDAAYTGQRPTTFAASYVISCDGNPTTYGDIRWDSTDLYRDVVVTPQTVSDLGTPVGDSAYTQVDITNYGDETAHVGALTFSGPNASEWTQDGAGCTNQTYNSDFGCDFYLEFRPTGSGHRTATLTVPDNSARGQHAVSLDGIGQVAPGTPVVTARTAIHEAKISWTAPADGGAPITSYTVYRTTPGQGQRVVETVYPDDPDNGGSLVDTNLPTGADLDYAVVASNAVGDGPDGDVSVTPPSDELLLDGTAAMPTDGGEPLTVSTADVRGRVAVAPGGGRIVYPSKYPGGEVDLAVSSPIGAFGPSRITTIGATDPAVSPDGLTVAFVHVGDSGHPSIWTVPIGGGTPTERATGVTNPAWLPDGSTLVAEPASQEGQPESGQPLVTVGTDGTLTDIPGTTDGHAPAVSPDGQRIAYELFHQGTGSYSLAVSPVTGGSPATSSTTTAGPIGDISWRTDGHELYAAEAGRVLAAPFSTGSGPGTLAPVSPPDVTGVRWPAYINSLAVSLANPAALEPIHPSVRINSAPGATTSCRFDGGDPIPCHNGFRLAPPASAGPHTLVVSSTPPDGIASSEIWPFTVDAGRPTVSLRQPSTHHFRGKRLTIRYIGHDNDSVASYDVRYRVAALHHKLRRYHYPADWQATTHTTRKLHVKPSHRYCLSVRSRDAAGNVSHWSAARCVTVLARRG